MRDRLKAAALTLLVVLATILVWQVAAMSPTKSAAAANPADAEYEALMGHAPSGSEAETKVVGFPTPAEFATNAAALLAHPFHDGGPNDKGIGIQIAYSLGRVALGYRLAVMFAIPPASSSGCRLSSTGRSIRSYRC